MAIVELKAEMTGIVCAVDAEVGTVVDKGASIIMLESMKMEFSVEAPCAGTLAELFVQLGDAVVDGTTLACLTTDE